MQKFNSFSHKFFCKRLQWIDYPPTPCLHFVYISLTTHPPQFVNVNCERPLIGHERRTRLGDSPEAADLKSERK